MNRQTMASTKLLGHLSPEEQRQVVGGYHYHSFDLWEMERVNEALERRWWEQIQQAQRCQ